MNQSKLKPTKKKLTDNELAIELRKLWDKGERGKTNCYELLRTKFKIEKSRTIKAYDLMEQLATTEALSAQSEANIQGAKDAAAMGIKTKNDRLLILQKEVDECLKELYGEGVDNFADFGGGRKNVKKQLTVLEKTKLRQTIVQLQGDISKMEGDYAPTKIAATDKAGNDVSPSINITQVVSRELPILENE